MSYQKYIVPGGSINYDYPNNLYITRGYQNDLYYNRVDFKVGDKVKLKDGVKQNQMQGNFEHGVKYTIIKIEGTTLYFEGMNQTLDASLIELFDESPGSHNPDDHEQNGGSDNETAPGNPGDISNQPPANPTGLIIKDRSLIKINPGAEFSATGESWQPVPTEFVGRYFNVIHPWPYANTNLASESVLIEIDEYETLGFGGRKWVRASDVTVIDFNPGDKISLVPGATMYRDGLNDWIPVPENLVNGRIYHVIRQNYDGPYPSVLIEIVGDATHSGQYWVRNGDVRLAPPMPDLGDLTSPGPVVTPARTATIENGVWRTNLAQGGSGTSNPIRLRPQETFGVTPVVPVKSGYRYDFVRWESLPTGAFTESNSIIQDTYGRMLDTDTHVKAVFNEVPIWPLTTIKNATWRTSVAEGLTGTSIDRRLEPGRSEAYGAVAVAPATPGLRYEFSHWTLNGETIPGEANNPQHVYFRLPANATADQTFNLEAVYTNSPNWSLPIAPIQTRAITVNGGIASAQTAVQGRIIDIVANRAPEGKKFSRWSVLSNDNVTLADMYSPHTTFVMPNTDVAIDAVFLPIETPTGPTYPETGPTYPETGPTYPETGPTYPETGPTYPETGPTYPETGPTYPETGPTYPETGPTYPETGPTYPETGPTYPETGPTYPETGPTYGPTYPETGPTYGPTYPETGPTYPETGPTNPETGPTYPETGPTETGPTPPPASEIVEGDYVRVNMDATHWATGEQIARWVNGREFPVFQIRTRPEGRQLLLGSGPGSIYSWIWERDVTKVGAPVVPEKKFTVGDVVMVNYDAKHWATGQHIATWVNGRTYPIIQTRVRNGHVEVLLGNGINSWILADDVTLYTTAPTAPTAPTIGVGTRVRVNNGVTSWATGQGMPAWVNGQTYNVIETRTVAGVRQLLLGGILSWIRETDVAVV